MAAVTLGMVGPKAFAQRIGRNEAFNHAGNASAAAIAAATAYFFGPMVVFWLMSVLAVASIVTTLWIPADAIDNDVARGLEAGEERAEHALRFAVLLASPPLLIFAGVAVLFHSPTRPCCRWSDRSWRWSTRRSAPA